MALETLKDRVHHRFSSQIERIVIDCDELTVELPARYLYEVCLALRDEPEFDFKLLVDVCGVDYLHYGQSQWETESATETGFSRGVEKVSFIPTEFPPEAVVDVDTPATKKRFASVYHLLSINHNHRIRIRVYLPESQLKVPSVVALWPAANWFEREAYDFFGIVYEGHPDLRRILTDYGFTGHPFRKDFPLMGHVEVRYDAKLQRVVYEPVGVEARILEPKVIRNDNRYRRGI